MMELSEKMRKARLVFYEQDIEEINKILAEFLDRSQAKRALLVVIFDDRTTLGMVRLYADELTQKLSESMIKSMERNKDKDEGVSNEFVAAADQALDDFFGPSDK